MAKSDNNLTAVFTDTANAIKSKTGRSLQISPRDFADEIASIESADKYKQMYINLLKATTVSVTIPDEVTSLGSSRWKDDLNLETIEFNNVTVIPEYTCHGCSKLATVSFNKETTDIETYAFYNCSKFGDTTLPHTLTEVGQYAFCNAGSDYDRGTHTFTMINNDGVYTTIGSHAFDKSNLSEITACLNNVEDSAFRSCSSLTKVDVEIHGKLNSYAFDSCSYVVDFKINSNSVITSLGSSVFQSLGYYNTYSDPNFHIADFDFRNSTFKDLPTGVWSYCRFNGNVYFPSTLEKISGNFLSNATDNWKVYFNSIPTVSSSSYLRSDSSNFTVKYCFPYELIEQASSATNWSSHKSQMVGYGTGFEAGSTLPQYTRGSGVSVTWYSDMEMTTVITTSSSATDIYYCSLGSTRLVWYINAPKLHDASVTISDGTNTYTAGDPVLVNTSITVTPAYTDPSINVLYKLRVNDADYTSSGTATINMDQDLTIVAMYWDGEHQLFLPTLSDNSWNIIKLASEIGEIPSSWNVGDTKDLTYDGETYTARLVDKTGKFTRVEDDSIAYLYFELTESLSTSEVYSNGSTNTVTESSLLANMNSGTIWDNLDAELKSTLEEVNVKVSQGKGFATVINFPARVFLGREHDLFSTKNYCYDSEWNAIEQDEYYQTHDTNEDRAKKKKGSMFKGNPYWLMSPISSNRNAVSCISNNGACFGGTVSQSQFVALRFAL